MTEDLKYNVSVNINMQHAEQAAEEAGCTVYDVLMRLRGMYEANLHEDLKWVVQDIQECGL
jgi:hypothetical protein